MIRSIWAVAVASPLASADRIASNRTDADDVADPVMGPLNAWTGGAGFSAAVKVANGSDAEMVPVKVPVAPAADCVASAMNVWA